MKFISTLLIVFSSFFCYSQKVTEIDSLLSVIADSKSNEDKASAHGRYAWLNLLSDTQLAKQHLDTSFSLYNKLKSDIGIAKSYY